MRRKNPRNFQGPTCRRSLQGLRLWTRVVCMYPLIQRDRWRIQLPTRLLASS